MDSWGGCYRPEISYGQDDENVFGATDMEQNLNQMLPSSPNFFCYGDTTGS